MLQIFTCSTIKAQGYLKANGKRIVNEKGENVLLRGIGLGGWMLQEGYMLGLYAEGQQYKIRERIEALTSKQQADEFYAAWLNNHTTKADIDSLKAWGFNSVRLPMHYNLYTLPIEAEPVAGKNTWLDKGFAMTDSLLAWCKANNMYLILDL
ncbi:MAG: glycosyl hydrolase family 5, partial [Sphingobacteriales bacterium]